MKNFIFAMALAAAFALSGCGTKTQELTVDGRPGQDGISMGIDISSVAPSCLAGGSTIKSFVDSNRNSELDADEIIKKVSVICNGINGTNGTNGIDGTSVSISTASASLCPTGGIVLTAGLVTTQICNGEKGDMGPAGTNGTDGAAGPQGVAGKSAYEIWLAAGNTGDEQDFLDSLVGADGQNGTNGSNGLSAYQIWLSLGNTGSEAQFISALQGPQGTAGANGLNGSNGASAYDIWLSLGNTGTQAQFIASLKGATGSTGATGPQGPQGVSGGVGNMTPVQLCPGDSASFKEYGFIVGSDLYAVYFDKNQPIAFLAKLNPGSYVTTNGSNCHFTYANNGSNITLSNGSGTTTVAIGSSSGGSGNTLAGSCNVIKTADYQSEQQFQFAVTGMASYSSYTLEVTFNNGAAVNQVQDSNGGASSYNNPLYTIAPQNLATGFNFYAKHNGNVVNKPTVATAKVKKNGQEMTCSVSN